MKRLHNDERGQSMVIIALAFVALVAFLALVIDGGTAFAARRQMQNAADAAALAGVRELFSFYECSSHHAADEQDIYDAVVQYAQDNGVQDPASNLVAYFIDENLAHCGNELPTNGTIPNTPTYSCDAVGVEATTTTSFSSFFATVIGQNELGASGLAAAILDQAPCMGPYVVWADSYDHNCGLDLTGSSVSVGGSVHSNSNAHLTGTSVSITGNVEYCGDFVGPGANYGSLNPWPSGWCDPTDPCIPSPWQSLNIDIARFAPGGDLAIAALNDPDGACQGTIGGDPQTSCYHYFTGHFMPGPTDDPLPEGLYYVDGNVHIKGTDLPPGEVKITIVTTGTIRMEQMGANHITAYSDLDGAGPKDLLLFSNQDSGCTPWVIDISSSGTQWTGIIFAPRGNISISSADITTFNGAIWGYSVNLSGSTQTVGWNVDYCDHVEHVTSPSVFLVR